MTRRHCSLKAPISGKTMELSRVPDPVFSERMTGDGIAILAEGNEVLAPCDGEITVFFETKHAFAITTTEGIQVLVHVGLDTIVMDGAGITALHGRGEYVKVGTPILRLDLDLMRRRHINLISPLLVVNFDKVSSLTPQNGEMPVKAGMDTVLEYAV